MEFRIADTFTDSLAKLTNQEQKVVKTTVFDLQLDPSGSGLRFHKLERSKDKNFWSVSANMDLRIIVHRSSNSLLICYVDHHDKAYKWVANRKLEVHPKTGAAQLVEIVETIREIEIPTYVVKEKKVEPPLKEFEDDYLLRFGIPKEWIKKLKTATENQLLEYAEHLPAEAAEAALDLAVGNTPILPVVVTENPFDHPDAQRRFRIIENKEALEAALDAPWDKWIIFLHPTQRALVEKDFNGAARVSGSAGTGKTVVALHRAAHLARANEESRILLTTFSDALANALMQKLRRLLASEPRLGENIEVYSLDAVGKRLYAKRGDGRQLIPLAKQKEYILSIAKEVQHEFTDSFLWNEWQYAVDLWQVRNWNSYKTIQRTGRKKRLSEKQREILWTVFEKMLQRLFERNEITQNGIFEHLAGLFQQDDERNPYTYVVVDEAQDISVTQLRFLAAMTKNKPNSLFFAGDLGQRIFQAPFSWKSLGVDIRGRSSTLRINYRTSHQIRQYADRLLASEIADVDGNKEDRRYAQSVFNGPIPEVIAAANEQEETQCVASWIQTKLEEGVKAEEIALFVRSNNEMPRAEATARQAQQAFCKLDEHLRTQSGAIVISTMHLVKGLEFRAVIVMACDDEVIPSSVRIDGAMTQNELEEIYETERHLLYVACTRARDYLLLSHTGEGSEFLQDMRIE